MTWEEPTNPLCCGDLGVPDEPCKAKCERGHCSQSKAVGFPPVNCLPSVRRKDTWLCVFIDIFPFKKSKAFLANIFPDSDLKEIHFFWLFCMNTTPQGYLLPTLRTFSGRNPHLEDSHFLCNGTQFPSSFHVTMLTLYSQHPWTKALSLFISYFTDFFFPLQIFNFTSGVGESRHLFHK